MKEEMKQYTCIKNVKAIPMDRLTAQEVLDRQIKTEHKSDEGYLIEYEDGYKSWSPKEVFEKGYVCTETHVDRMKFELSELRRKIVKLTLFLLSPEAFEKTNYHHRNQLEAMQKYADILVRRIYDAEHKNHVISRDSEVSCDKAQV